MLRPFKCQSFDATIALRLSRIWGKGNRVLILRERERERK